MAFKHYPQINKEDIPSMNIENVKAYLKDFSLSLDIEKSLKKAFTFSIFIEGMSSLLICG